jgi:light-regulated signal transduction histidine kinase (bacteriophytochrome)
MSVDEEIQKLGELLEAIEEQRQDAQRSGRTKLDEMMSQADELFNRIIADYTDATQLPSFEQAYQVSELQKRLHDVRHNLPSPVVHLEHGGDRMAEKNVVVYTTPT